MSNQENIFSLSKDEKKLLSALVMYGAQTFQELIINTELNSDKAQSCISKLLEKEFIIISEQTGVYRSKLPLENLVNILDQSSTVIETTQKTQFELLQNYKKIVKEELDKYRDTLEKQLGEFKVNSNQLKASLQENIDNREQQRIKQSNELINEFLTTYSTKTSEYQNNFESGFASENARYEEKWVEVANRFQNIPEAGMRIFNESIKNYDKELSNVIDSAVGKISSLSSLLSDVVTAIESESASRIQTFFSATQSLSQDFKNNLHTGLNESRKHEIDFINNLKNQIQVKLVEDISKSMNNVIEELAKDLDKDVNESLDKIKNQTKETVSESSEQIKSEFKEFAESATELLQEQKTPITVLSNELNELTSDKKLERSLTSFSQQLQTLLTAELATLEANYRRALKTTTDIVENIRRSTKSRLVKQNQDFENLLNSMTDLSEKAITRKDQDIIKNQDLSRSLEEMLKNLLVSIPMRSNNHRTMIKNTLTETTQELQDRVGNSSKDAINDIYNILSNSKKRIEEVYKETLKENEKEIQNIINSSDQINSTLSNLYENYSEKIERRFEKRAKVMNTELEALSRNFQNILAGIESNIENINDKFTSEASVINIESNLQNSVTILRTELNTLITQNQADSQDLIKNLDNNLQSYLNNTLELIKEGFSNIKNGFKNELENQLTSINERNGEQLKRFEKAINSFSDQNTDKFSEFKTNITKNLEQNRKNITVFVNENRHNMEDVINLYKSNISKYQEKGPTDILSFINQIESEVSTQNKNVKDSLEELLSFYDGLSDSTLNEVNSNILQVHESGDKLLTIFEDSLNMVTNGLTKVEDQIDGYFSDSMTEFENQIGVAAGLVSSEIDSSTKIIQDEAETFKKEVGKTLEKISESMREVISQQEIEFQTDIPESNQQFSQVFDELIKERSSSNQGLERKINEDISHLIDNWNKQILSSKEKLNDITKAIEKIIGANTDNLETIVSTNVDEAIKRINSIYDLDSSKEDVFGLREIQAKIKQANKRLRTATTESLRDHMDTFDQQVPELLSSYEAIQKQTEEDLDVYLEDLNDSISNSQTALLSQLHDYLKEERTKLDFSESREDIKNIQRNFSQKTPQSIDEFSNDVENIIDKSSSEIEQSHKKMHELIINLSEVVKEQNLSLLENLEKIKNDIVHSLTVTGDEAKKSIITYLDSYSTNIEKLLLSFTGKSSQLTQGITEELENKINSATKNSSELFNTISNSYQQYREILKEFDNELSRIEPLSNIRLVKLATDESKNELISEMIKSASKQVTIFASNPVLLSTDILKSVPSDKRIWIFTNYDFTKKGKKWLGEIAEHVNINLRQAKTSKLTGLMVVKDEDSALILPDNLGYVTSDSKFVMYLAGLLTQLKGSTINKESK